MTDLVVVSLERWDDVWRRNQYLVDGLLRADPTLRVLFVEPAADPIHDVVSRRAPSWGLRTRPLGDSGRLWNHRPVKWLPRRIDPRADERLAGDIARAAAKVGFHSPLLWINDPGMASVMRDHGLADALRHHRRLARRGAPCRRTRAAQPEVRRRCSRTRSRSWRARPSWCAESLRRARGSGIRSSSSEMRSMSPHTPTPRPRPSDLPAGRRRSTSGTVHADRFDVDLTVQHRTQLSPDRGPSCSSVRTSCRRMRLHDSRSAGVVLLGPRLTPTMPAVPAARRRPDRAAPGGHPSPTASTR